MSLNRMRCKTSDGGTWTTVRVREMGQRLGIPDYDPAKTDGTTISLMKAAEQLGICVGSAKSLVLSGVLGVQRVIDRRPIYYEDYQYDKVVRLPGL